MRIDANIRLILEDAFKSEPDGILSQTLCAVKLGFNTDCDPVIETIASFLREDKIVKIEEDEARKLIAEKVASEGEGWCIRQKVSSKPRCIAPNFTGGLDEEVFNFLIFRVYPKPKPSFQFFSLFFLTFIKIKKLKTKS